MRQECRVSGRISARPGSSSRIVGPCSLLGTFTVSNLAVAPDGLLVPLLVKFTLAPDWQARGYTFDTAFALLSVTAGIGGLIGGLLISTWGGLERRRVYGVIIPMLVGGVAQAAYGLSPLLLLCAGAAFVKAFMEPIFNAHSQAIWQSITPRELQGRVFSVRRLIAQATWPLGTTVAGLAAGVLDPWAMCMLRSAWYGSCSVPRSCLIRTCCGWRTRRC